MKGGDNPPNINHLIEGRLHPLAVTVAKLDMDEPLIAAFTPPGYAKPKSCSRSGRSGGGIAVIAKPSLFQYITFKEISNFCSFQALLSTYTSSTCVLNFLTIYRPPRSKRNPVSIVTVREELSIIISSFASKPGHLVILGDLNFHFDNHLVSSKLNEILDQSGMLQIITEATQRSGHILDCVIVPKSMSTNFLAIVSPVPFSDHDLIEITINIPPPQKKKVIITSQNFRTINIENFKSHLKSKLQFSNENPIPAHKWNDLVRSVLDDHAPIKDRTITERKYAPWFSDPIKKAKSETRKAERLFRKTGLTVHREIFQHRHCEWRKLAKKLKADHYKAKFENNKSCKQLFKICDELLGREKCKILPNVIDKLDQPEVFANFFRNKVDLIREKLDSNDLHIEETTFLGETFDKFHPVNEQFVRNLITKSPKKSCELDPLPAGLLSLVIDALLPSITSIINNSLSSGFVPPCFKMALVHPQLKKPSFDQNDLKNYRPVSNLPFISKLMEKVVLTQINSHIEKNNLQEPFQSAYKGNHSTETGLLKVYNDLTINANENKINILCLLDLSAAFDTIDHSLLLKRLEKRFGITGSALNWFKSYLVGRQQSVVVDGVKSVEHILSFGVPQGSVLGPVLFTMYMQPLSSIIANHNLCYHFYADDSQIYGSASIDCLDGLIVQIEQCFAEIKQWMNKNRLKLNDEKTEIIKCGRKDVLKKINIRCLNFGSNSVKFSDVVRNLGVFIDSELSMSPHVHHTIKCLYIEVRRISKIRHLLPINIVNILVNSLVLSKLDYCNSLLTNTSKHNINSLQLVQNNAARLIFNKKKFDSVSPLFLKLHWLPVEKRIIYKICSIVFKTLNSDGPLYLKDLINVYVPLRNLRSMNDDTILIKPKIARKIGEQSFYFSAPQFWNSLPMKIRNSESCSSFKSSLKTFLFLS